MKKIIFSLTCFVAIAANAQPLNHAISFKKGAQYQLVSKTNIVITQELMGQSIDINTDGEITHNYEVKSISDTGIVLLHTVSRIKMHLNGMGQERTIDSDKPEDLNGDFGASLKSFLQKSFQITVDNTGRVLSVNQTKIKEQDPNADMMNNLLKQVAASMDAPGVGDHSFFQILPGKKVSKGDSWTDSTNKGDIRESYTYTIADITSGEVLIDFTNTTHNETTAEVMGMEASTKTDGKGMGKIILDRSTGIIKKQTATGDGSGAVEVMGQTIPMTTKNTSSVEVTVK